MEELQDAEIKAKRNIRLFFIFAFIFFTLVGASIIFWRSEWFPYPPMCDRTIVKLYDYRIMNKIFEKNLPDSFKILQVYYRPSIVPGPDGPFPVQYEVHITAVDYQKLVTGIQMKEPNDNDRDFYLGRLYSSEKFHNDLCEEYYKSFDDKANYHPPSIYLKGGSWLYLDERTSPSLRLFISTRLPFSD